MEELPKTWVRDSGRSVGGGQGASLLGRFFEVTRVLLVRLDSAGMGTGLGNRVGKQSDGAAVGMPGLGRAAFGSCPGKGLGWAGGALAPVWLLTVNARN